VRKNTKFFDFSAHENKKNISAPKSFFTKKYLRFMKNMIIFVTVNRSLNFKNYIKYLNFYQKTVKL